MSIPATALSDLIDDLAANAEGFWFVPGRGWVDVKARAAKYAADSRRDGYEHEDWKAEVARFIEAVNASDSWCCDLEALAVFENAVPPRVALFDQLRKEAA